MYFIAIWVVVVFSIPSQGRSQDFLKGGAQLSLTGQTVSPACQMYCGHITGVTL